MGIFITFANSPEWGMSKVQQSDENRSVISKNFAVQIMFIVRTLTIAFLVISAPAYADDLGTLYVRKHVVSEVVDRTAVVEDSVRIWSSNAGSMRFLAQATFSNLHYCELEGEAKRVAPNLYEYSDASCKVRLRILGNKLLLSVKDPTDPKRKECNPLESSQSVCGANTAILTNSFRRIP